MYATSRSRRDGRRGTKFAKYRAVLIVIGFTLACADVGLCQGYGGPSMLSRGGNRPGHRGRAPVDMVVYGAARATLETGLTPVAVLEDGSIPSVNAYGAQAEIGVYGNHTWRKSILGVDYRGDYRQNTRYKAYNGFNHALSLDYQYQLSNRTQLALRELAGSTNRAFGGFVAPVVTDLQS